MKVNFHHAFLTMLGFFVAITTFSQKAEKEVVKKNEFISNLGEKPSEGAPILIHGVTRSLMKSTFQKVTLEEKYIKHVQSLEKSKKEGEEAVQINIEK
jgi:hypothetical protein